MSEHRVFSTSFASVYPLYVQKAERKGRTRDEVDRVIRWLTGYDQPGLKKAVQDERDFRAFFAQAPGIHPNAAGVEGIVERILPLVEKLIDADIRTNGS